MSSISNSHDEETTLLLDQRKRKATKPTPLPKAQISIVLLLQLAEPVTFVCIYPFINQLVSELDITGGDETKVGYYAGIIQSLFFVGEACTIFQWSRLSDRIGRRPVVLMGLAGMSFSMVCFGLSKTFRGLVVSRCLAGFLNGNTGVIKSLMGELTDQTNIAQASALIPIVWSLGATIGPLIGGQLSHPYERFHEAFGRSKFWKRYPYFLPCAVSAAFSAVTLVVAFIFLKEPVNAARPSIKDVQSEIDGNRIIHTTYVAQPPSEAVLPSHLPPSVSTPLPMHSILTPPVLVSVLNYALLALVECAVVALHPLFLATSIELGGLGLSPATIGTCLGSVGILNGLFQACFFAPIHRRFGTKRVFVTGLMAFFPIFTAFPLINFLARHQGMSSLTWSVLAFQMSLIVVTDMSYACSFIYITAAARDRRSLGATHGLAQTAASVMRAISPAAATSLFALSIQHNLLGGWFVYVVLIAISLIALSAASLLPRDV